MDISSIIRAAAPFLSAIFGAVTAVFAVLLFTRSRRLQREAEQSKAPVVDGRQLPLREPSTPGKNGQHGSRLLRKFIEYAGNVSLTS
jgi:hypothetical protein